jgi:hypothetical protein
VCAGDDGTDSGAGLNGGEAETLDDESSIGIEPPNRVECRSARPCASLTGIDLSTDGKIVNPSSYR